MAISSLKFVIFFWVCFAVPAILATPVRECARKAHYPVKVKGVSMEPDPVVSGQEAKFTISANSGKSISGGEVTIDVNYFGVHVHSETIDLCKETSCPVSAGDFALSHIQNLPGFTPPGLYTLKMSIHDGDKQLLTCIRFNFNIALGASVSAS